MFKFDELLLQIEAQSGKPVPEWIRNNVPDLLLPWDVFSSGPPPEQPANK